MDTPPAPDVTLAETETKGVGVAEVTASGVAVCSLEPADEPAVADGELPSPDPVPLARPVMELSVGADDASLDPTVA